MTRRLVPVKVNGEGRGVAPGRVRAVFDTGSTGLVEVPYRLNPHDAIEFMLVAGACGQVYAEISDDEDELATETVIKQRTQLATGTADGESILKALGLEAKHVTKLAFTVSAGDMFEMQITSYMTRGQVADLAAEFNANPPQLKEEKC